MRKLLICLSLILVLTLVFVGCKDKTETPDVTTPTTEAPTKAPVETPTETPTEAPTTEEPTTEEPTEAPTTEAPTEAPTTEEPTEEPTEDTTTEEPTTEACTHNYETVVTEPTCETAGETVKTCTVCGDVVRETIDALGHALAEGTEWNVQLAPTCTETGVGFGECANCGEMVVVELPALGHDANEATCSAASVCATCGETVAPALPHTTVTVEEKAPTCTEVGYTAGEYCSVCGSIESLVVPATGHNHIWVVTTAPTFTADGVNTGTCACGDVVTMPVAKKVPTALYTFEDLVAAEKVVYNKTSVTPNDGYVTLNPLAYGASINFLNNGKNFQDVISIKYRVSADYVSFAANKDAYFNVNGQAFYASLTGKNVVDYDNAGTAGEWTLLNIDFRKTQVTIDGVEYDMFSGAALEVIEFVLFNGYREGLSIDIEYVAFFDTVADAEEYATNFGEVATPVVYAPTEKNYNTSLNNTNGAGEYGAPGKYVAETNNFGATIINWNGRFFNNLNLTAVGTITVDGGVQKLLYSFDGGLTWLEFAEGMATVNADGTYTAKFDLSAFEGKTVDIRVAAVLSVDGKTTEYASVLNIKKVRAVKGNLNDAVTLDYLAAAGNQKSNITATVMDGYVHYAVSGKSPVITLFKSEEGMKVGQYMLIKYRGQGSGYGSNYDFYFDINGSGSAYNNIGGKKYNANWFNLTLDGTWNYIIVDLANGFGGKTFDMNNCTEINWIIFDGTVTAAKGDWFDIAGVQFFDTYADARAVANPNGEYIGRDENGSTYSAFSYGAYATLNYATGTAKPAIERDTANLFQKVTLVAPDYMLVVRMSITSNVAFDASDIGLALDNGEILYGAVVKDGNEYQIGFPIPENFESGREYKASLVIKSKTNNEIVLLDEFTLIRQPEGLTITDEVGTKNDNKFAANTTITLTASAKGASDVVALYYGDTLVMYYGAYAGVSGFKANGGSNVTIADAGLATLTTDGQYTIKLHSGSINGPVVAEETVTILNTGEYYKWTAREIYYYWQHYEIPNPAGNANWGLYLELKNDGQGEYVRMTTSGTAAVGAGRLFLAQGKAYTTPKNASIGVKYRNYSGGSIKFARGSDVGSWAGNLAANLLIYTAHNANGWYAGTSWNTVPTHFTFASLDFYVNNGDGRVCDVQYIVIGPAGVDQNSTEGYNFNQIYGWQ